MMDSRKPYISCIILSCDSHINKGNSVLHCLQSILRQGFNDFEIILVENSHRKTQDIPLVEMKVREWNDRRPQTVPFILIDNKKSQSYGAARNRGAGKARGEVLVFIDDDTIVIDSDALRKIAELSLRFDYGYGAQRLWTRKGWFEKNSHAILERSVRNGPASLLGHSGDPTPLSDGEDNSELEKRTFIANFGFCRSSIFKKLSGFIDFPGYGFEDDHLMCKLFEGGFRYVSLGEIKVVHVSHEKSKMQRSNFGKYFMELVRNGYYGFNVQKIFTGAYSSRQEVLEPLRTLHYDHRVEAAYRDYLKSFPLDLQHPSKKRDSWGKYNRLGRFDFARLLDVLQRSKSLDAFIKDSNADFDNVGPIIRVSIQNGIVTLGKQGAFKRGFSFHFTENDDKKESGRVSFVPRSSLNQFPCDIESRKRRYQFLKQRYPFAEFLKFALIGDDDFLSLEFIEEYWASLVVIEKDTRIVDILKRKFPRLHIVENDVRKVGGVKVQTFITDPPYTLHGALAFILCGLNLLERDGEMKEFYVILNQTMMGRHIFDLQKILAKAGVYLHETIPNFSQYKLPSNFEEHGRAHSFISGMGAARDAVTYSSSSNLYIWRTLTPDTRLIRTQVDYKKMYQHYI